MTERELPLDDRPADPRELATHREAQLDAFKHSGIRRHGISFERALQTPPIAICLRIAAEIRIKKGCSHGS